ncbi:hypothetical protein CCU68_06550 [Pseudomonas gingeri NCPPB 3146 = LMG 5327]|uniref:Uncharacterized protein n=3 Tax=Pseudomonas gingeri TaxID=117681 RepID=A0A7Y7XUE1_9PSED|nr:MULTISPECIES: hypothetical protein [Pseudomonas]NVZ28481.1 hypothetical protein [Pseudomonas gingeri]NVZ64741.1 hypothetical protein [Pseudomonas gingeri]NVZ78194.1 hypothetical protein [Pseudomonas gingeri]NWA03484.1 hypothetical protein [Pseudomonas gingeri]NWA14342.1 hypothetical protein [Pseudomonas gingeri]
MTMIDSDLLKPYLAARDSARAAWRLTVASLSKTPKEALEEGFRAVRIAERAYYRCCEDLCNVVRSEMERAEDEVAVRGRFVDGSL